MVKFYGLTKPSPIIKLVTNSTPLPSALPARPRYTTYHTRGTHAVDEGLAASTIARRPPPPAPHRPLSSGADGLPNHHTPALYSRRTAAARCTCAGVRTRQSCCSAAAAAAACSTGASGYLFAPRGCFLSCCKILFVYLLLACDSASNHTRDDADDAVFLSRRLRWFACL